ncbi:uncharacterized protein LOC100122969 [Nasonia vitripennis]|uniref:Cuticle protein 6 n=1 Tax=Nasonia vitripennis TaxID=7425 RepID=A0A7M7QC14_NASVI|nr:uncharacterized protein LOC100122969 [Nasonia vitripennis]XP_031785150.1 uncharacterized protein LOC100122969 [Nasonia vitripennis]
MVNQSTKRFLLLLLLAEAVLCAPQDSWGKSKATTQYHTQNAVSGAYQYGYTGPHHAKSESSFNGVTRGGYSYIDANGLMQTVSYTADAENGFRVHASNLPNPNALNPVQDTPEVALAKKRHLEQLRRAESYSWQQQPQENYDYQPRSQQRQRSPYLLSPEEARSIPAPRPSNAIVLDSAKDDERDGSFLRRPVKYTVVPQLYAMPLPLIHSSMRHTQDSLGRYEYSYTGDTSAKTESRSLDGTTRGAYSYIDANGLLQQVHYVADKDGFRVLATNLPEA